MKCKCGRAAAAKYTKEEYTKDKGEWGERGGDGEGERLES